MGSGRAVNSRKMETTMERNLLRSTMRSILGLVLVAAATWLAGYITDKIFGPESTA